MQGCSTLLMRQVKAIVSPNVRGLTMPNSFRIRCINKQPRNDIHHRITHVGGVGETRWKLTVEDVIERIESGREAFHTEEVGHIRKVVVAVRLGRKYIKTEADRDTPDNLLSLPECP